MWSRTHRRANCLLYPLPLRRGGHSLMARVATCFYIREDHVLPQLCKNPLHCLSCTTIGLIDSGPLTQHFSFTSLPSILSKSLILASLRSLFRYQHWLHSLQPALSQPRLTCLTLRLPHNLSLPLYMAPSFSFPPHPLHPAAHTHIRVTTFKKHYPQTCVQSSFVIQFWAFTDNLSTAPTMHAVLRTLISIPGHICDIVTYLPGQQIKNWT